MSFSRSENTGNCLLAPIKTDDLAATFAYLKVQPERNDVQVIFNQDIDDWGPEEFGKVLVEKQIEVDAPGIPELNPLNSGLRRRKFVVFFACSIPPNSERVYVYHGLSHSIAFVAVAAYRQHRFWPPGFALEVALQGRPDIKCGGEGKIYHCVRQGATCRNVNASIEPEPIYISAEDEEALPEKSTLTMRKKPRIPAKPSCSWPKNLCLLLCCAKPSLNYGQTMQSWLILSLMSLDRSLSNWYAVGAKGGDFVVETETGRNRGIEAIFT